MTPRERVMASLALKEPDRVPFMDFVNIDVKQRIMGTTDVDEAAFAHKIGMDAIYFTDYAAPLYCKMHGGGGGAANPGLDGSEVNFIGEGLIRSEMDLGIIDLPDPHDDRYYDTAKRFIDRYGCGDLAIYAGLRPLGLMNVLLSMPLPAFADALYADLPLINRMMDIFIEWNCVVIEKLQAIGGIDFIAAYCDMAHKGGPFVSPQMLREIFLPKMKIAADAIKLPWAFHSDGDLTVVMEDLLTLGMNAINPIEPPIMNLKTAKAKWGKRVCLWGNIDLIHTLPHGTVDEVEAEVKQRIADAGHGGGYICATANSVTSFCRIENVLAMTAAVATHGQYPLADSS